MSDNNMEKYKELSKIAYDATIDDDGYIWFLISGDQGYENSGIKFHDLHRLFYEKTSFEKDKEKIFKMEEKLFSLIRENLNPVVLKD